MRSSIPLYDALAATWDEDFQAAHRRAYEALAWEHVCELLETSPKVVVDAGCGTGRWAARLVAMGHRVIGIEQAPRMIAIAAERGLGKRFQLIEGAMEEVDLEEALADLVIAMGSLQYTRDPTTSMRRFARWVRPGGAVCVLVDSLVAMVMELLATGRTEEALAYLSSEMGIWEVGEHAADLHLFDRARLESLFHAAGLQRTVSKGLLVSASVFGIQRLKEILETDEESLLAVERQIGEHPLFVDLGKQLMVTGWRGDSPARPGIASPASQGDIGRGTGS